MKKVNKHLWVHFSYMVALLLVISTFVLPQQTFRWVAAAAVAVLLASSLYFHHQRRKLNKDIILEYVLTATAAAVILAGSFRH